MRLNKIYKEELLFISANCVGRWGKNALILM